MNFEDLCKLIPEVNGEKLPSNKYLRENVEVLISDSSITVYKNEYFSYTDGIHTTVFTKNDCSEFSYKFSDGTESIIDNIDELDWKVVLFVVGEERIKINRKMKDIDFIDKYNKDSLPFIKSYSGFERTFENGIAEKNEIENALGILTKRQREVFEMYVYNEMTQKEIARKLETTQQSISKIIKQVIIKLEKTYKNN
jgi:RNA polymerase sigma factor (sigma-70 family)